MRITPCFNPSLIQSRNDCFVPCTNTGEQPRPTSERIAFLCLSWSINHGAHYDRSPPVPDLGVPADRRDEMGSGSCILTWLHNETIHLDPDFVDCILHTPREFQNTKALVSVPHSPSFPLEVVVLLGWPPMLCPENLYLKIALIPEEKTSVSSFENRSLSRMTVAPSSSSSGLSTVFIHCQFAICRASPSPKTPLSMPAVQSNPTCPP